MNICLAIISDAWAGAETVVYELARHLRDRGENVCILLNQEIFKYYTDLEDVRLLNAGPFFRTTGLIRVCISPKIGTEAKEEPPDSFPGSFYLTALLREIYYKRVRHRLAQSILSNKIDIIHSHLNAGIVLVSNVVEELDIPFVATLHGLSVAGMERKGGMGWLTSPVASWRRERFRRALEKADRVTAVSDAELDAVENCGIPLEDKSVVISNGVNICEIQSSRSSIAALKSEFNLLFPGGAKFVKGGDLLIKALPKVVGQIGGIHLYVAGDVPRNHLLRKMVIATGLDKHVTFTGFLGIQEYRQLLNSVDLLVMPSREEYFGIVFLEAMALGKPVIAGNVGGIPELIENGRNGILVDPDPDQVAEAILYLYENEGVRQEMGQNNLHDVSSFDWSGIIDRYVDVYKALTGR
jgi:glycosyltransferase involved in cell wall biosynthesis